MIINAAAFILGAVIGSFLNVCIYRVPAGLSVVSPPSRCSSCGAPVKFYDNVPIISYLALMGKCRSCRASISIRYPLIELLNALLYVAVVSRFGNESIWVVLTYCAFVSAAVVIIFIDIDHMIIPNGITYPGIPLAVILGAAILPDPFMRFELLGAKNAVIGFLAGGGGFWLISAAGRAILKKDAMGGGDIKLMAMIGGLMGWKGVILTTFMGSLAGSVIGVLLMRIKGREWGSRIPFGPYLILGSLISLFWGQEIITWYLYAG